MFGFYNSFHDKYQQVHLSAEETLTILISACLLPRHGIIDQEISYNQYKPI